jgi:hypothetical protein
LTCPVFEMTCPEFGTTCPGFEVSCPGFGMSCPEFGVSCPEFGVSCPGFGTTCPVFVLACPVFGTTCPRSGRGELWLEGKLRAVPKVDDPDRLARLVDVVEEAIGLYEKLLQGKIGKLAHTQAAARERRQPEVLTLDAARKRSAAKGLTPASAVRMSRNRSAALGR